MTIQAKLIAALAVLLVVVGGAVALGYHERGVGRTLQQQADAAEQVKVAAVGVAKAETVLVAKTDTFTVYRTRTVALHDTVLKHLTDTLLVKQYVAASDSTIRACSDVILSCDTVRARYRLLVSKDSTLAAIPKVTPGFFSHFHKFVGPTVSYTVDDRKLHAGVSAGYGWTW